MRSLTITKKRLNLYLKSIKKKRLGQTQNELKVRLFDEVKELLSDFTKTDEYLDYLCSKIREAARFADGEEMTIYISPSDKEKQTELEKRTGMTITISEYDNPRP